MSYILAFDPSFTAWGWAVIDVTDDRVVETGCIKTESESTKRRIRKGDDRIRRIRIINEHILETIKTYNIKLIVSEQPHGSQSAVAALMIGVVLGIVQSIGDVLDIPIEWYSEADAKKSLLGRKSASKDDIIKEVDKNYKLSWHKVKYKDEAVADAIAVFHVFKKTSTMYKLLKL